MIADRVKEQESRRLIKAHMNTGTLLDFGTAGKYLKGIDDQWWLNGGFYTFNVIMGRPQTWKSGLTWSFLSRLLNIYPESEALVYDSENSITDKKRIYSLTGDLSLSSNDLEYRVLQVDKGEYDLDSFAKLITEEANERMKRMKDLTYETPFINEKTGQTWLMTAPLFVVIDSWSAMESLAEMSMFDTNDISDSSMNRVFMVDGVQKAKLLKNLVGLATRAGIYVITTAHVGSLIKMDRFDTTSKDLQHMKTNEKMKGVSEKFASYAMTILDTRNVELLAEKDNRQVSEYPFKTDRPDLNHVNLNIVKCKADISGLLVPMVISAYHGVLSNMSSYIYLKDNKFGITGEGQYKTIELLDDLKVTRKNLRQVLNDRYEVGRCFDILCQIHFIKRYWFAQPGTPLERIASMDDRTILDLFAKKKDRLNDIFNSRGYWMFDEHKKKDHRPYMSLFGIIDIINELSPQSTVVSMSDQQQKVKNRISTKLSA